MHASTRPSCTPLVHVRHVRPGLCPETLNLRPYFRIGSTPEPEFLLAINSLCEYVLCKSKTAHCEYGKVCFIFSYHRRSVMTTPALKSSKRGVPSLHW
eukprot:scaffold2723_cov108-Isochrysis_galbana.AAC.4